MAKKLNYADMAAAIITQLGTQENLTNVNHCATRLRVVVRDPSKVDAASLKKIDGVLGVEVRENQVQVIVGQIIEDLFLEVEKRVGKTSAEGSGKPQEKKLVAVFSNFLQLMAGIMSPVIPSLIAAGFLTCLLLLLNLVFGLESTNSTYVILNNLAQSVFYFLPVFVAYTSAKKFDTEPVLAMLLACWLLYPDWVAMAGAGGYTSYFGIPALLTTYNGLTDHSVGLGNVQDRPAAEKNAAAVSAAFPETVSADPDHVGHHADTDRSVRRVSHELYRNVHRLDPQLRQLGGSAGNHHLCQYDRSVVSGLPSGADSDRDDQSGYGRLRRFHQYLVLLLHDHAGLHRAGSGTEKQEPPVKGNRVPGFDLGVVRRHFRADDLRYLL